MKTLHNIFHKRIAIVIVIISLFVLLSSYLISYNYLTNVSIDASLVSPFPLSQIRSWACQLQGLTEAGAVQKLVNSSYDMVIIEPTRTVSTGSDKYFDTSGMVQQLKNSKASDGVHRKLVIAYVSIGEAEYWRWYWTWSNYWPESGPRPLDWPDYILSPDPDGWEGCFPVAYWDQDWKDVVIYGTNNNLVPGRDYKSIIDEVILDGFDGIYMDWVGGYEYQPVINEASAKGLDASTEMVKLITEIHNYTAQQQPNFIIIQQNAATLIDGHPQLLSVIDAISHESIWYSGSVTSYWSDSNGYDIPNLMYVSNYYTQYLDRYISVGIPVFNLEYAVVYANDAYNKSKAKGYVAYCSRTPLSQLSTTPPSAPSPSTTNTLHQISTPTSNPTFAADDVTNDEDSWCFLATASSNHPNSDVRLQILRNFRDSNLTGNRIGQDLVSTYYIISPPVAKFINDYTFLKPLVRNGFIPAIFISSTALNISLSIKISVFSLIVINSIIVILYSKNRIKRIFH